MANTHELICAGFGGQGVLLMGQLVAYAGMHEDKNVSWLPSYGPEMRGGTANCSIIISDSAVGSPIVNNPDCLIVMNLPSFDKYENAVVAGGTMIVDSTLIAKQTARTDVKACYVPATQMAADAGIPTLANMILVGKFLKECSALSYEDIEGALKKVVSAKKMDLFELNLKAIRMGYEF